MPGEVMTALKRIYLLSLALLLTGAGAEPIPEAIGQYSGSCKPTTTTVVSYKFATKTCISTKTVTKVVTPTNCYFHSTSTSSVPPPACTGAISRYSADYDDLQFVEIGDPTPIASPGGGPYKSLVYNNFYVDQFDGFIQAATGNQWAMSYDYRIARTISMDPAHPNSYFDLESFYVACSAGVPQPPCLIELVGYQPRVPGGAMVTMLITYPAIPTPVDPKDLKMMKVTLGPEWKELQRVEFKKVTWADGTGEGLQGLMVDAFQYVVKECPPAKS